MFQSTASGVKYSITPRALKEECYPQIPTYQFNEFAGCVFEMGGYSDMTIVDPYTGRRLWVGDVFAKDGTTTAIQAMRKVLDVAEELKFLSIIS